MADLNEETLTDAVIAQMASTPDPRMREVMESLVRHLHAFARDVRLTPQEWLGAIDFLTRVGQACTPYRQEFILLSDTIGLSRLVNLMDDKANRTGEATEASLLGPFYRENAPEFGHAESMATRAKGPEMILFGRILDDEGRGVPNAVVEAWQTDADGAYDLQANDPEVMDMRGRYHTDADGHYAVRTLIPLGYSIPMDGPVGAMVRQQERHGMRPAHIHVLVAADGYRELVTALYLGHDANIDTDTVFGVSESLVVNLRENLPGSPVPSLPSVRYDFRISKRAAGDTTGRVGADPSKIAAE
ncbi:dioxygenase [Roseomonas sp. CCTCC AB2023176]|uniref:dioxygenase family protein n=1 Tax=Roseomonas sp. CCTCC AB2023176 TaxID=3342640 RepID=UPI0035E39A52